MTSYREYPPHTALADQVRCVWTREVGVAEAAFPERIVPDGCVDLIWMDGELMVVGPDTEPRIVPIPPGGIVAGVRLRPGRARLLLGAVPTSELRDLQVGLAELWGPVSRALAGRAAEHAHPLGIARALERVTLSRLPDHERDIAVEAAVAALDRPAPPPIPALAREMGLSERQLRRRFAAEVGYGPKTLEGVLRFRRSMRLASDHADSAEIAALAGYADQPHLTREVRRLSGQTPGALFARLRAA